MTINTNTTPSVTTNGLWKYRLVYIFVAWIVINSVPKGTGAVTFTGAVIIYPFAMSYISLSGGSLLKAERAYVRQKWKLAPLWAKIAIGAAIFVMISPVSVGVNKVSDFISMLLLVGCVSFPFVRGKKFLKQGISNLTDET